MNLQDDNEDGFELSLVDHWAVFLAQKAQSLLPRLKWGVSWGKLSWIQSQFTQMGRWPRQYDPPIWSSTYIDFENNYYKGLISKP